MKCTETQPRNAFERSAASNISLYPPKPFRSNLVTAQTKPKSRKKLKVSFAEPLHFDEPPMAALRERLEEDGDDGYGSTDNLSSETCSSNSSIVNGAANPYQRPPLVHTRFRIQNNDLPSGARESSTQRSEEVPVAVKPPVKLKPRLLPKPTVNPLRQQSNREKETEPSLKTSYGYVRLQRVPSFRKMNQDLRRQKRQALRDNDQVDNANATLKEEAEVKDSTLQRKLKALCIADERKLDTNQGETNAIGSGGLYEKEGSIAAAKKNNNRSTGHHHRTDSYEAAINEALVPSEKVFTSTINSAHCYHNEIIPSETISDDNTNSYIDSTNTDLIDEHYNDVEETSYKHYTYDQHAVPAKGILKKSKHTPQVSYSFDSYDQERGFAICVHDQSQGQVQGHSSQDFFQAASSFPQPVIPGHEEYQCTMCSDRYGETEIRREAQMEAEMNGLYGYQPYQKLDHTMQSSNPTPVHKIMLENERYRNLYNSSSSAKFLRESSQYEGDNYDTSDTLHRRQLRKATELLYGRSSASERSSSPQITVRNRSPSPELNLRARSPSPQRTSQLAVKPVRARSHSPSLRLAAEAESFSQMSNFEHNNTPTGSLQHNDSHIPSMNRLRMTDSTNDSGSSTASIYERYNVPLDNAFLYKINVAPNVRPQSPGDNSDTSTNVDSGFNDTFDGIAPTDGTSRTGDTVGSIKRNKDGPPAFHTNVNRLQKALKEGNKILSSTGLHILSSHKQKMDNEYSKYLKLLSQVQRQQEQKRRTSAPVISGADNLGAFSSNRQQPMKVQFVKTAELYKMMEQQRRPPTPPISK